MIMTHYEERARNFCLDTRLIETSTTELTALDTEVMIDVVSKLMNLTNASVLPKLVTEIEVLLGTSGIALGIYDAETQQNQFVAGTVEGEVLPEDVNSPCPENGVLSVESEGRHYTLFFEGNDTNLFSYLCVCLDINEISNRQKQIIRFTLPYFFAAAVKFDKLARKFYDYGLTDREQEVVRWIVEGKDNWSISQILGVAERTVKFHNRNIYKKMGVNTKVEVICMYHQFISSLNENPSEQKNAKTTSG